MKLISKKSLGAALLSLTLVLTACNSNSDAVQVLETENTSLKATLAAYTNYGPTMTAQATVNAQKMATMQSDLNSARAQVKDLTNRLNAPVQNTPLPSIQDIANAGSDNGSNGSTSGNTGATGNTSAAGSDGTGNQSGGTDTSSTAASFAAVVTAKKINTATGCADTPATTFATTDAKIYVVADARNFKAGTTFTAQWSGGTFNRQDTWTAPTGSAKLCIYFYIQPSVLALTAGSYSVTMSAGDLGSSSAQFTVQ